MIYAVEVNELRKDYRDFSLNNISFSLPSGHVMGFAGQNGAGKTTTIRLILNMTCRDKGTIKVLGMDNILNEQLIKQDIGVVFDDIFFVDSWKVYEVERVVKSFYTHWDSKQYRQYVSDFELPMDKKVKELSRGMKMKLMLATAMSHNAKLLILDEPTSGIDPVARNDLIEILSRYVSDSERSIFFSTHITTDLEKIADYITLIDRGSIFYTGTTEGLLERFYLIKGSLAQLTDELRKRIIGLSTYRIGFQGLVPVSDAAHLSNENITLEKPVIDDLLMHISKRNHNE